MFLSNHLCSSQRSKSVVQPGEMRFKRGPRNQPNTTSTPGALVTTPDPSERLCRERSKSNIPALLVDDDPAVDTCGLCPGSWNLTVDQCLMQTCHELRPFVFVDVFQNTDRSLWCLSITIYASMVVCGMPALTEHSLKALSMLDVIEPLHVSIKSTRYSVNRLRNNLRALRIAMSIPGT